MGLFSRGKVVPVLKLSGTIGTASPLRQGLSLSATAGAIERAFEASKLPSVAVVINSPGGSPVQSNLMFKRIRQLAEEKKKRVYVFCEDVAASGGYFLAVAGDEIYADPSSIVGSIGVISASFGLDKAIAKLGIERRVYTAGTSKSQLDPFQAENPEDIARLKSVQRDIHDVFIGVVKERRAGKLNGRDEELFSGAFWSAGQALEHGLIDGISDVRTKMREIHGDKVKLKLVPIQKGGLLGMFRKAPSIAMLAQLAGGSADLGHEARNGLAADVISTLEERAIWARYGL